MEIRLILLFDTLNLIVNFNDLIIGLSTSLIVLLRILLNLLSILLIRILHQIIWFEAGSSRKLTGHTHRLRDHVPIVLIHRVVLVAIGVHIHLI